MNINEISPKAFADLHYLQYLNLSINEIDKFLLDNLLLQTIPNLRTLDLRDSEINFDNSVLKVPVTRNLVYMGTNDWRFCCLSESLVSCDSPKKDETDCHNIVSSLYLKSCIWLIGISSICLNLFVISYQSATVKSYRQLNSIILINLAIADSGTGLYMLAIGTADFLFEGSYVTVETWWRQSPWCLTLSFLQNFSMEASLANLLQMSLIYMLVIGKQKQVSMRCLFLMLLSTWVFSFLVGAAPLLVTKESTSGVCYFHVFFYENSGLLVISDIEHLLLNGVMIILSIGLTYVSISKVHGSAKHLKRRGSVRGRRHKQKPIILLVLQLVTRVLCWCPLQLVLILSLCGISTSLHVITWLVMFVLSLSSIINPCLFTIRNFKK